MEVPNSGYQYKYNGKELQDELGLNVYDYGARSYDPALGRWMNIDPKADKYFDYSPYNYTINNPLYFVDPNGEDIYLWYALTNNHKNGKKEKDADAMFWAAALTRAMDFLNSSEYGSDDVLIMRTVNSMDDLKSNIEGDIADNKGTFGKTAECGLWSNGGADGPFRKNSDNSVDQLSVNGWGKIDFNWSSDANAYFYGCRTARTDIDIDDKTGMPTDKSFVEKLSNQGNMRNINVWGQTTRSWPSPFSNVRLTTSSIRKGNHYVPTYLVGSYPGRLSSITGQPSASNPMAIYKNGVLVRFSQQPGRTMTNEQIDRYYPAPLNKM